MPIRPIEVMRTQNAAQIKHVEHQRMQHEQVQINKSFQERVAHQQQKPVETKKSEQQEKRYDAKEKGNGQFSNPSKKKQANKEKEQVKEISNGPGIKGGLDIKI